LHRRIIPRRQQPEQEILFGGAGASLRSDAILAAPAIESRGGRLLRPAAGDYIALVARKPPGANMNSEFPSHNAFSHLGTKADLVKQLDNYCRGRVGYEAVLRWCHQYAAGMELSADDLASEPTFGVVYLLKSGQFYRIARSNPAGRRELPERAKIVHAISTDDPCGIEAYWHKRFDVKRQNVEWFALDSADVTAFKRRTFM
jgi:hypothetical protein